MFAFRSENRADPGADSAHPGPRRGQAEEDARRPVSRVLSAPRRRNGGTRDGHSSGTRIAARLARPTRATGRECPRGPGPSFLPPAAPIRSCSRWGLPCRPCCQERGALLPHRFTLARRRPRGMGSRTGGLFSVALSLGSPPPAVDRHRIPVEPGLSSIASCATATVQPSGPRLLRGGALQVKAAAGEKTRGAAPGPRQRASPLETIT